MAASNQKPPSRGLIPKAELRKIKQRVAKLRKQGHEIWTDDEVTAEGWETELDHKPRAGGLHVGKEKQQEEWDCGLACAQMVLGVLGESRPTQALLKSRIAAPSVWTIDLAYLLADFGVSCQFLTATPEINAAAYSGCAFYAGALDEDARRVDILLRAAKAEGVEVSQKTLSAAELWNMMRDEDTYIIALVDARLLHRRPQSAGGHNGNGSRNGGDHSGQNGHGSSQNGHPSPRQLNGHGKESNSPKNSPRNNGSSSSAEPPPRVRRASKSLMGVTPDSDFMGHYVLLLGLDDARGGYVVNDPARDDERTFVTADALEAARHAAGTDEDLILIDAYQGAPTTPKGEPKIVRVCEQYKSE